MTGVLTLTPMSLTDKNLFAYCDNNPVMRVDDEGDFWLKDKRFKDADFDNNDEHIIGNFLKRGYEYAD